MMTDENIIPIIFSRFKKIEGLQGFQPCSVCFAPKGSVHDRLEIVTNIDEKNPSLLACSVHGLQVAHDAIPTCYRTSLIKNQKSFQNGRIRTCKPSLSAWF
jgi:hypothetical protein